MDHSTPVSKEVPPQDNAQREGKDLTSLDASPPVARASSIQLNPPAVPGLDLYEEVESSDESDCGLPLPPEMSAMARHANDLEVEALVERVRKGQQVYNDVMKKSERILADRRAARAAKEAERRTETVTVRSHAELEAENASLRAQVADLQAQLREAGIEPRPFPAPASEGSG